jgi:SEC-C motif
VAKSGRNQPCPCESGRKVKHCCGTRRGPSPEDLAWQTLRHQARKFAPVLKPYSELDIDQLLERVIELPVHHYSLQIRLPRIWPPALERLRAGIRGDTDDIVNAVQAAAATIDGPHLRLTLAYQAAELCQHDEIDLESLAIIIVDLARPTSLFVCASLIATTAVSLGRCPTPAGLLVAAS